MLESGRTDRAPAAEERRLAGRIDGRIGPGVRVRLAGLGTDKSLQSEVVDYSTFGLAVEVNGDLVRMIDVREGAVVTLSFQVGPAHAGPLAFECRIAWQKRIADDCLRIGFEFVESGDLEPRTPSVVLDRYAPLLGMIEHPFLFNQTNLIRIIRLSRRLFVARCSDPSFAAFPGLPAVFSVNVFGGKAPVHGRFLSARRVDHEVEYAIGIDHLSDETEESIVRYVLATTELEPFALSRAGFRTKRIKDIMSYRFVASAAEYEQTLALRKVAYSAAGKASKEADAAAMVYWFDERSRILSVWHGRRLVGSVCLVFPEGEGPFFEVQRRLGAELSAKLPPTEEMIEVAGLCLSKPYRKTDVLIGVFQRIFQVMIYSKKKYILASCDAYLWELYKTIGFEKTGLQYSVQKERLIQLDVILAHRHAAAYGWSMDPMRWNEVYQQIAEYLDEQGVLPKSPRHLLVSPVYRLYIESIRLMQGSEELIAGAADVSERTAGGVIQRLAAALNLDGRRKGSGHGLDQSGRNR